ncbi:molecular chaperone HtpG [Candidatus Marinamargulisbacteria bacterium SCGC AG-439-L15]|nr:molecular chaperone HtpG [Candidatus Marinamargulisbacteria bacterium SCGC AG-439-L15]
MSTKDTKQKGTIKIHTENIFPIIKKWLYSDHEIFMRELISNSFDAIKKLKKIAVKESLKETPDPEINIRIDEKAKTICISDTGLGMDAEEVEKYITQIAFSGAEDFIKKYQDKDDKEDIIGHFGLGFYSAFMVADTVEIHSLSYKKGAKPIHWKCEGQTDYTLDTGSKKEIGTDIILHINKENKSFLTESTLEELVKKYANFLPVKITLNDKEINNQNPIWIKTPTDLKKEDYDSFFQSLFPFQEPPLFHIHLNVDYPFRLQGILYFPKVTNELDSRKGRVKLFCQQVFVTDNADDIIPEFLTLLQGVIDCPDFPLNVSRSALQNDPYVQKISKHIVKKVADKLTTLFKKERDNYITYWKDIHPFIKYGMMQNDDFYTKMKDAILFESSTGDYTSLSDYISRIKNPAKKEEKNTIVYSSDKVSQSTYIESLKAEGVESIFLNALIDTHFIQFLESKDSSITFKSVDTSAMEHLVDTDKANDNKIVDKDNKTADDKLSELFKKELGDDKLKVEVKSMIASKIPAMISEDEQSKRFKTMSKLMNQDLPAFGENTLILNNQNPIIQNIIGLMDNPKESEQLKMLCEHVYDLALMAHEPLNSEKMQAFIERSTTLLEQMSQNT